MKVHGIVCSYLGDGEYDVGKTAAWLNNYVNTLFFYDLNYGQAARKYAVDYSKTFPDALFAYHPASVDGFYADSALFRQMAFEAALDAWGYANNDWVVFIDASESVSSSTAFDQLTLDTEHPALFSLLLDEARAGTSVLKLPVSIFLDQGTVREEFMSADPALGNTLVAQIATLQSQIAAATDPVVKAELQAQLDNALMVQEVNDSVLYWTCDPHYADVVTPTVLSAGQGYGEGNYGESAFGGAATVSASTLGLDRMFRVDYAKSYTTWERLDDFLSAAGPPALLATIVSYSYARYGEGPPPWAEDTDGGFANRKLIQQVRSLGLPETYATADPVGVAHPVGTQSPAYCYLYADYDTGDGDPDFNKYVALWRQNPRDGVWYINYTLGPVPVDPITGDPSVDPAEWDSQAVATTGPSGTGQQ